MLGGAAPAGRAQDLADRFRPVRRVVHHYDFDERAVGNLEEIPKFWVPLRPPGFPHYTSAAFDFEEGRAAPPSFHVSSEGRNVAYHYTGPETRVRINSDYRIEAYIRPDRLHYARACFSAHFLDKHGQPIPRTLVRTRYVGGPEEPPGWTRVELFLSSAPPQAHSIGLIAWVVQEPIRQTATPPRHVPRVDVFGGAWFDDITIYRLPHAQITSSALGNVLTPDASPALQVVLADLEDDSLEGTLSIFAADGVTVQTQRLEVTVEDDTKPTTINIGHLPPGLYEARLEVTARAGPILTRSLTFARLAPLLGSPDATARSLGVVVDAELHRDLATELNLLQHQALRSAKLPVWYGLEGGASAIGRGRRMDRFYQELIKKRFTLTAVFVEPPAHLARGHGSYLRSLVELLALDTSVWDQHLAAVAVPHASVFRGWQLGADSSEKHPSPEELGVAAGQLRRVLRQYITSPLLGAPRSTASEPPEDKLPVDQITLQLRPEFPTESFSTALVGLRRQGYQPVSAFIASLPSGSYHRLPRLADWTQRIITARHVGFDVVYVPQTWTVRETPQGIVTEPTERYILLRTLADVLGDSMPDRRFAVSSGATCLTFQGENGMIAAMWDEHAPDNAQPHAIQLGRASRQIDLWGQAIPLKRNDLGQQIVQLSAMPILVDHVEPWLVDFRTSMKLKPAHVESGQELVSFALEMAYQDAMPITGHGRLEAPEGWEIRPRNFSFALMQRRTERLMFQARIPHNEPVGRKRILAKVTLDETGYYLEIPLEIEVGLSDVEVFGLALVESQKLLLRQTVTNRSTEVLSFRATANVPGRQRQYRPIANLAPGETQTVEYRFSNPRDLIGRHVQLSLRELNDGPRVHSLELQVP